KPRRLAQARERINNLEGLPRLTVAGLLVENARQPVDHSVDVGANEQPPEFLVVAGICDHRQVTRPQHGVEARGQLRPSRPPRQARDLQRNRSSPAGRIMSLPVPWPPPPSKPRTTTTGVRAVLPMTIPAAAARSSATASTVAWRSLPSSSAVPRRSMTEGTPAMPSATFWIPTRQGRPNVSEITMPSSTPLNS